MSKSNEYDCVVIGAGMFGSYAASYLSCKGLRVALLEKEGSIFARASKYNQSRVHNGYHYPKSYETAKKVAKYYERFCKDYGFALLKKFDQYYAISKNSSFVSANDYEKFCKKLNLPLKEVDSKVFFKDGQVQSVFKTEEQCFDYLKIRNHYLKEFDKNSNKISIFFKSWPEKTNVSGSRYQIYLNGNRPEIYAPTVINTTYSNVNNINNIFGFPDYRVKYELCEMSLCNTVSKLHNIGLTVMDGSFFSVMPFGDGTISSLSSVKHTPISVSYKSPQLNQRSFWELFNNKFIRYSNWSKMNRLATKFLNDDINKLSYIKSVFEIKPILVSSEEDDSRPTIITTHSDKPTFISVLAGKISTMYDMDATLKQLV